MNGDFLFNSDYERGLMMPMPFPPIPAPPVFIPKPNLPVVITKPVVLPDIIVEETGGDLFDITPKVKITTSRLTTVPWWVWAAGAVALYFVLSGKAGRRRSSW